MSGKETGRGRGKNNKPIRDLIEEDSRHVDGLQPKRDERGKKCQPIKNKDLDLLSLYHSWPAVKKMKRKRREESFNHNWGLVSTCGLPAVQG